jgi:hypothetical protein
MRDGLADGLARVRERVDALRGRSGDGSGGRYVLLPSGAGRRRRLAEVGAVAGVVVVVLAFVGATMAMRSSSAPSTPDGPGLPAPAEFSEQHSGPAAPPGPSTTVALPEPTGADRTGRGRPLPSAAGTSGPSGTPTLPAPTTRVSASVPPVTRPPVVTTPPVTTTPPPVTESPTPSPTPSPTTDPPVPPGGLP